MFPERQGKRRDGFVEDAISRKVHYFLLKNELAANISNVGKLSFF